MYRKSQMSRPKNIDTIVNEALASIEQAEFSLEELRPRLSAGIIIDEYNVILNHLQSVKNKLPRLQRLQEVIMSDSKFLKVQDDGTISELDPDTARRAAMGYFREGGNILETIRHINAEFRTFLEEREPEFWYK